MHGILGTIESWFGNIVLGRAGRPEIIIATASVSLSDQAQTIVTLADE